MPTPHQSIEERTVTIEHAPVMVNPYTACLQPGMGPHLVFNFPQPLPICAPKGPPPAKKEEKKEKKEEKKEEKKVEVKCPPKEVCLVQGDPTWSRPRMPVRKGQPLKNDPCMIQ